MSVQHHRLTPADKELNVTVVLGEDILDPADPTNATVPRRIFLVKPDGPAQYADEELVRYISSLNHSEIVVSTTVNLQQFKGCAHSIMDSCGAIRIERYIKGLPKV